MPLEGQMQGIGDSGWAEDFDQAWANRMIRDYGVSMEDMRDPGTRLWLNRQQRQKQAAAVAVKPGTGGPDPKPQELKPGTGGVIGRWTPGQSGPYGGINPQGGPYRPEWKEPPPGLNKTPGGGMPGPAQTKPEFGQWTPASPYGGYNPGGGTRPGQRPRQPGNIFQDPGRARTATSAFTLSTNQR